MFPIATPRPLLLVPIVVAMLAGCGGGNKAAGSKEVSHLRAITALYFKTISALGRNPKDEAEFKRIIAEGKMDLSVLGVSSSDELFISDRDNQPLIVLYGQTPKVVATGVIAYEQVGVDGKRLVGLNNGQVQEADAAQFAKLVPSPTAS